MKWKHVIALVLQVATTFEKRQERLRNPFFVRGMFWAFCVTHEK